MTFAPAELLAPVAKIIPHEWQHHGVTRVDPYHWLRDDTKADAAVLAHLGAENQYCEAVLAPTKALQDRLAQEMRARIADQQASVPVQRRYYQYWHTYPAALQYPQFWRAPLTDLTRQALIIDVNQRAQAQPFYQLAPLVYSEDEQYLCLAEDTCGDKIYQIRILQLTDGCFLADTLTDTSGDIVWGNDNRHFYYVKVMPGTLQRAQVYRHHLGTDQQQDTLVYAEEDPRFYTALRKSIDRTLVFILHHHTETLAVSTLDANHADSQVSTVLAREQGHRYWVEKHGNDFFILTNWQAKNFQLVKVAIPQAADKSCWQCLVAETADGLLEDLQLFERHLVYLRRERGLPVYRVLSLQTGQTQVLQFNDQAFSAYFKDNVTMSSARVRFCYDSLTVQSSIIEFDLDSAEPEVLQQDVILGGFSAANYQSEHLEFGARDGAKVPVTLVYRKDKFQRGKNPLYLEGYGAYGLNIDAHFRPEQLSLLDRGFVCAFTHVRGSSMLGWHWYEQGKLLNKHHTFDDFIDVPKR